LVLTLLGGAGYILGGNYGWQQQQARQALQVMQQDLDAQSELIESLRNRNEQHLNALALRLGEVQARATRLETLGQRLTQLGQLDDGEFDFREPPAFGGPLEQDSISGLGRVDVERDLLALEQRLRHQNDQLSVLENLISNRELERGLEPAGRPIEKGWLSSGYGKRADPFTAQPAMHYGIDFSGPRQSNILAVAGGVVTWSGQRPGYGQVVDIDHGNGYMTRYAHNEKNLVSVGTRVRAGDTIALMGSTGRATSSHVHFEVWLDGRRINPYDVVTAGR
jgi:murein DD-endopeptidase MepM/ murein hydrolase activator NlpD